MNDLHLEALFKSLKRSAYAAECFQYNFSFRLFYHASTLTDKKYTRKTHLKTVSLHAVMRWKRIRILIII